MKSTMIAFDRSDIGPPFFVDGLDHLALQRGYSGRGIQTYDLARQRHL